MSLKLETHRGIPTNPNPTHEESFKVVKNRRGQFTLSLPRIDDKKRLAGYPGLTGWSKTLSELIPKSKFYVEPFSGMAKVYQELDKSKVQYVILNDKAKPLVKVLKKLFPETNVTNTDYTHCIKKYDTPETFFLIDIPWYENYYAQGFSAFTEKNINVYNSKVLNLCDSIQGKFIITSKDKKIFRDSKFTNHTIKGDYPICGNFPELLITTNLSLEELN